MLHFNEEEGSQIKLFTPGPVHVPKRILNEMAKPNDTHRSEPYHELHRRVKEKLQTLLHTKNDCLIFTSSATGVMETAVRNLLRTDEKGLFLSCGAFGERWIKIATKNGKSFDVQRVEKGRGFTSEVVKDALSQEDYAVVFMQSNETATGVYNTKIDEIAPLIKDSGALLAIDDTSGMAGIDMDVDALGVDIRLASVQKAFALPPGLAVASISNAAYEKAKEVEHQGHYFDLTYFRKKSHQNETPTTPPIPHIRALNAQLTYILEEEGMDNRFKRHQRLAETVRRWVKDMGFEMFSHSGFRSNTVSCIKNTLNLDVGTMVKMLLDHGYRIVNGYGDLSGKTFRMGHMGELTTTMLEEMLHELTEVVEELT
ncbi:MAG: alanine--glyoxylate aminotransferase family protein [Candidatus Korarchaeota archaeon]|nr:alanine--glyoxylate aminotransferase family protein [Candidatus Korarchaeota archaeon]NIU83843.1 aminotransferase class V-fold PLP-dependent enzyme [Candidatus Thorarchaeota archaeon]NIW13985.1 aminotransferase class V-fold PLP-dependent enzyme [Candidatus Thorarchaeota archaeon]NIW53601.1 aminotransferase class V-fold PLP-dependent enzyme [Candidatus Korarchaeota archaeon]